MDVARLSAYTGEDARRRQREDCTMRRRGVRKCVGGYVIGECPWEFIKVSFAFCVVAFKAETTMGLANKLGRHTRRGHPLDTHEGKRRELHGARTVAGR